MKIIFLGVGEAVDKNFPNNSSILISKNANILLDCGFGIPWQLWKYNEKPDFLDAIYISHQHADHYFGLPAMLLKMQEDGRKKDLTIICPKNLKDSFNNFMDCAYSGFVKKFLYKINLIESKRTLDFNNLKISFEKTKHSIENLAIKIKGEGKVFCYSGDGSPLENSEFYKNSDFFIQETYFFNKKIWGHFSILEAIRFAEKNNIKRLALTHMNRGFRETELPNLKDKIKSDKAKIIVPKPLEEYNF